MKPLLTTISATALALMLACPASAEEVKVDGAAFANPTANLEAAPDKLHLDPATLPQRASRGGFNQSDVVLPGLTVEEIKRLQQTDGSNERGLRVGIGRDISDSFGEASGWNWVAVDGGKVAYLGVTSPGAVRIRAQLQVGELPEGVELRFFAPTETATVYGPFTRTELANQPKDAAGKTLFWSPSVAGDALKVEVFLPDEVEPAAIQVGIPQLSHIVLDPLSGKSQNGVLEANTASCFIDAACLTPEWQQIGRSAGGYFYHDDQDGHTGFCSGTLVNTTVGNKVPYFLTANHCVDSATEASSMNFFWQYANSACGSNDAGQRALFTSGAKFLTTSADVDTTLVQLNDYPPGVSYFTGWSTTAFNPQEQVGGVLHAGFEDSITPKAYAQGDFLAFLDIVNHQAVVSNAGKRAAVQWTHGITAPGSSGSGLWAVQSDGYYLKGLLSSGSSSCSNPTGLDFYTRMDQAYPMLKPWLNPAK